MQSIIISFDFGIAVNMHNYVMLTGHTARVLYMALSPDGSTVISGAADETLRMWKCFAVDPTKTKKASTTKTAAAVPFSRGIR